MYLLHIKTSHLCIQEETILTDTENWEEAVHTKNLPKCDKDLEVVSLDVSLEDVNLLYECKLCYTKFRSIDTLKLHSHDC